MPRQLWITDEIAMRGKAAYNANIKGVLLPELKIVDEPFVAATSNDWTEEESHGCTIAHAAADGGAMTITAGGTAQDCGELLHTAQWSAASNCGMQAKVKISQISDVCVCVGFVDQVETTDDHVAMEMNGAALAAATNTKDFCGMVFDTEATTDVWYVGASKNGTEGTPVAATGTLIPVADTYFYVRVQTDTAGNVLFYYGTKVNELKPVGILKTAIACTSADLLTPYVGFIARSTVAQVCTVSRITIWQDN